MQNNIFSAESLSQNIIVLDQVDSTNNYLKSKLSNFKPLPELTAIMAKDQTQGRGQRENSWLVAPNLNLTFSILLYPNTIKPQDHFLLNVIISLGIMDWLKSQQIPASIKWPNDLMISNKKIGGILIENSLNKTSIRQSIVGIGINVNQIIFPETLQDKASSIKKETGHHTDDLKQACLDICYSIGKKITSFRNNQINAEQLMIAYNSVLFKKDITSWYFSNQETFEAKLIRVEKDGRLILNQDNKELSYNFKEVVFILQ